MPILDERSLIATIDNVNDLLLSGRNISTSDQFQIARWISEQHDPARSYAGLFSPTVTDMKTRKDTVRLFTGDFATGARAIHCVGQEAARIVALFNPGDPGIKKAYDNASKWMHTSEPFRQHGTYCFGTCSAAFWRHFSVGRFDQKEECLIKGVRSLKALRKEDGTWRSFPFFYTVFALLGLDLPPAIDEIRFAGPRLEKYVARKQSRPDPYSGRKKLIAEKALAKIG